MTSGSAHRVPASLALPVYLALTVVVTAVLSPPLLALLHTLGFGDATLVDVTLRLLELVAIAFTFGLLAVLGGGGWRAWGVLRQVRPGPALLRGMAIGVITLVPVCALLFVLQVRLVDPGIRPDPLWWLAFFARSLLSAFIIAISEELWFRGGLFTSMQRAAGVAFALFGGATVYAAAHFLDVPGDVPEPTGAFAGFEVLGQAASQMFRAQNLDSFVALLLAGIALGVVRLRQGHVFLAIGIHAGWVFTIKVFKKFTYILPDPPQRWLAGHYDGVIGWAAAVCLGLLLLALLWRLRPPRRVSP